MALTEERKGQIALLFLKYKIHKDGIDFRNARREMGNVANSINIPIDEIMELYELLTREVIDELFHGATKTAADETSGAK